MQRCLLGWVPLIPLRFIPQVENGMNPEDGKPTAEQHKEIPRVVHRLQIQDSPDPKQRERGKAELRGNFLHKMIGQKGQGAR